MYFKKGKGKLVFMVILAMMLQIVGPVVGNVYAEFGGEDFTATTVFDNKGNAKVYWEYTFRPDGDRDFEIPLGFMLLDDEEKLDDEKKPVDLIAEEGIVGEYEISQDGMMKVTIGDKVEELVAELWGDDDSDEPSVKDPDEDHDEDSEDDGTRVDGDDEPDASEDLYGKGDETGETIPGESEGDDNNSVEPPVEEDGGEENSDENGTVEPTNPEETGDTEESSSLLGKALGFFASLSERLFPELKTYKFHGSFEVEGVVQLGSRGVNPTSAGGKELGDIFTDIKLEIDDIEVGEDITIEINEDTEVKVLFTWELANDLDLEGGDWARIKLPHALSNVTDGGNLFDEGGEIVGTYSFEDGYLKVMFNDKLVDRNENRHGEVGFLMKFELEQFEDDASQLIEFGEPAVKSLIITAKPSGEDIKEITKSGVTNASINPTHINWVIDVNTTLDDLKNAIVTDIIPDGLDLEFDSVEVYELIVGRTGKKVEGGKVTNPNITETDEGFKVKLVETNKAYRIKYSTKIVGYPVEGYTNKAELKDNGELVKDAEYTIDKIERGSLIEKSGWANNDHKNATKVYWQIDVNKAEETLNNAIVEDSIPQGLKINNIKIYELNKSGDDWNQGTEVTSNFGNPKDFPISLSNISVNAYRILVETDIDYGDEYKQAITFENTAILKENDTQVDSDNTTVNVTRKSLLEKSGYESTSYDDPEITWTIKVNEANHSIKDATITDIIGDGLSLRQNSIKVDGSTVSIGGNTYPRLEEMTEDNKFVLKLGDISSSYTITYVTDITDPTKTSFSNTVELKGNGLSGDGIGQGGTITKTPSVEPTVNNAYNKGRASNKTIDGITYYNTPNYEEKTMSWVTTVDAKKEKITELTITDTFEPAGSMVFIADNLRVLKNGELVGTEKYTLTDNGSAGFVLKFNGELDRTKYEIYYKTSFDPDIVIEEDGTLNTTRTYTNKASFSGKVQNVSNTERDISTPSKTANYTIKEEIFNGGKKDGSLNREGRVITWKIYVNALSQTLTGEQFKIEDILSEGQVFNDDINVYEYSLNKDGTIDVDTSGSIDSNMYSVDKSDNGFTLTFSNGIDKPYVIEYTTTIKDISKATYSNTANTYIDEKLYKTYMYSVGYERHDKFVDKNALNLSGGTAYTDDEINWKVTLNESLSDIKNAIFRDTVSSGQVYLNGSLKLYKGNSTNEDELVEFDEKNLTVDTETEYGKTIIELSLGDIDSIYTVTYDTVVISTGGTISNSASLLGTEGQLGNSSDKRYNVKIASWGTGTGQHPRGGIRIIKKDAETNDTIANNPAKFELYYILNGEKRIVNGEAQVTQNGVIEYGGLPFRTYYLKEVEAPRGYELISKAPEGYQFNDDGAIEIVVNSNKEIIMNILNDKIKTDVEAMKDWIKGPSETPEIWFKLYRELEGQNKYPVDVDIKPVDFESNKAKWYDLDETDINGNKYIYSVQEVDKDGDDYVPENYTKSEEGLKVTNTYVIPKDVTVKAIKKWIGGENTRPQSVKIHLNRNGVPIETITLNGTEETPWSHTWKNLERTDDYGEVYKYTVDEERVEHYGKSIESDGLDFTITNTYQSPVTDIIGRKVWENGELNRPDYIELQLYRHTGNEKESEKVGNSVRLEKGTYEYDWKDQPRTDEQGNEYTYFVKEITELENYTKSEDGLTVTNTYVIPKTSITGTKVWEGGSRVKPTIELQLYQDGVPHGDPVELKDGETEYTWDNLDKTDINGREYKYTIDEVRVPTNYRKSISLDGLTITNTYVPPYIPPTDPEEPTKPPTDPEEPTKPPMDPEEPTDPPTDPEEPTDPPTDPTDPIDPTDPVDPIDPIDTPTDPEEPTIKEETPKETPKEGDVEVPEEGEVKVNNPPENGRVTIDENGKWTYTPNPGFVGKDRFSIIITHPDGTEEEIFIEIDVTDPLGALNIDQPTLPKTGEISTIIFYLAGLFLIILGIVLRKRIV